jgi:hypothetical protein
MGLADVDGAIGATKEVDIVGRVFVSRGLHA